MKTKILLGIKENGVKVYLKQGDTPPRIKVIGQTRMGMSWSQHIIRDKLLQEYGEVIDLNDRHSEFEGLFRNGRTMNVFNILSTQKGIYFNHDDTTQNGNEMLDALYVEGLL